MHDTKYSEYGRVMRRLAGLLGALLWANVWTYEQAYAQPVPATVFAQANRAIAAGDTATATRYYEELIGSGVHSAAVFYNLANVCAAQQQRGKAILNYERAARLAPFDAEVQHNLAVTNAQIKDEIEPMHPFFLVRWVKWVRHLLSADVWAVIGLLIMAFFGVSTGVWLLGTSRKQKRDGFVYAILSLLLSIVPFWFSYELSTLENHSGFAIVLLPETTLHTAADTESPEVRVIHEGLKIELLDETQDWCKVELPNGEQGWLLAGAISEI